MTKPSTCQRASLITLLLKWEMNEWTSFNFKGHFLLTEGRHSTSFGLPTWTHTSRSTPSGSWRWRQSTFSWGRLLTPFGSPMWTLIRSWITARQRWLSYLSSFGVPKEMSKAMVAILVLDQLTSQTPDWPWHYSILSYTGQEMPKTQLCCSFVIEAAPLRPSSNSCYCTRWMLSHQISDALSSAAR